MRSAASRAILLVALACHPAFCQQPEEPFEGPAIEKCPADFAYRIDLASEKPAPPTDGSAGDVLSWNVIRTAGVTEIEMVTTTGKKADLWFWKGAQALRAPGETKYIRHAGMRPEFFVDLGRNGFPDTDWISRKTFVQKTTHQGRKVLYFHTTVKIEREEFDMHAWVDFETRYPIAVRKNDKVFSFQMLPPPTAALTPPAGAFEAVKREQDRIKRLTGSAPGR